MIGKELENNQANIIGVVAGGFEFNHEIYGEAFYTMDLKVERLSASSDIIPVMISERLIDVTKNHDGVLMSVEGQFRSYNRHDEHKNKLVLSVFAREVEVLDTVDEDRQTNHVYLEGFVCKEPIYRKTPLGREIADLLIAVNRPYGKSDYIPCISWGRNAKYAGNFQVGEKVAIWGRIQSREYMKKISEEVMEKRVAYEVSVSKLETLEVL
ncbi:MAG: single-stranded DNA-binding protein [Lachnospiraceae bacterium]